MKNFFSSLFNKKPSKNDDNKEEEYKYLPKKDEIVENKFTVNFSNNGGKFLYASNLDESTEFFSKIIEENSWSRSSILCFNENIINQYVLDFKYDNFSFFVKKCARIDPLKGVVLINIAAR